MGIEEYIQANEQIYQGKKAIKYVFCEGNNPDKLIVTFPGFTSPGTPPQYNYVSTLMDCDCHRLFILDDYGPRGSYLIGKNRDNSIEDSVVSLISDTCKKYGVESENVILQGSAKGGYCALYFGIKYKFGHVIAGAPEINLGNYLLNVVPEVVEYIAGGNKDEDQRYLNDLLFDLVEISSKSFPEIFIHVGKGDHHYQDHVIPFLEKLNEKSIYYNINLANYSSHGWVGSYYQEYLLKTLNYIDNTITSPEPSILKTTIKNENGFLEVSCTAQGDDLQYACYIFKENEVIKKIFYQKEPCFQYPINTKGTYRARIYVKENEEINSKFTDELVIDYNNFKKLDSTDRSEGEFDIDIYGSCVSRDIFNFDDNHYVKLGKYFARNSFISAVSEPFPHEIDLIMSSPWQKRMVETDLRKDLFEQLSVNSADYLLVDFIDERAALIRYENSIFTLSIELQNSNLSDNYKGDPINKFTLDESFWKKSMDKCVENLLKIYPEEKIIIHEAYFVYSYVTKYGKTESFPENRVSYYKKLNMILKQYYDYLKTKIPHAHFLNIIEKYDLASENHRWGLSPAHYEDAYYKDALNRIKSIINQ